MKKILHVKSSPRVEGSVSRKLGSAILDKIVEKYPESEVKELDLAEIIFPHMGGTMTSAFYTPEESRSSEQAKAIKFSDDIIADVQDSDIIVIESPMYNFTITSTLKTFIDHITRPGVTFRYTDSGPEGLIKNKKVYIAFSSGWIYDKDAPVIPDFNLSYLNKDFNVPYLKVVLGFLGMTDVIAFRADGTGLEGIKETAYQNAFESIVIS